MSQRKPKRKVGRPTKATPERIASILVAIARGLTREQACAKNDVSRAQFSEWEKRAEFPDLREKALAERADFLLGKIEQSAIGWQRFAWLAERPKSFRDQFADPGKAALSVHLNQQINGLRFTQAQLEEARARLDETKVLQLARRTEARAKSHEDPIL